MTPAVTIGGETAVSDGTKVVKNKDAVKDWTKTTKVTFTPAANGNEGIVVIDVKSVKAGYICAIEITDSKFINEFVDKKGKYYFAVAVNSKRTENVVKMIQYLLQ